jgi:hypothetical protein
MMKRAPRSTFQGVETDVADGKVQFNIDNLWAYTDLGYGVSTPPITLERGYNNVVRLCMMDWKEGRTSHGV